MASAIVRPFAQWYFNKLTTRLAKMGMTYHDAIADTGVYDRAISRLPAEMKVERQRRFKRASDLSSKHVELPASAQENPWKDYKMVQHIFSETQKEHDERRFLTDRWWMPYHIGRETWHKYDTKSAWFWQPTKK